MSNIAGVCKTSRASRLVARRAPFLSTAGGALIMLPSSAHDWADPDLAWLIGKTQRSPAVTPRERVRFLKLAWDAIGSEFGSRHIQYEMFYAGARFVSCGYSFRNYDWAAADALVEGLAAGCDSKERAGGAER